MVHAEANEDFRDTLHQAKQANAEQALSLRQDIHIPYVPCDLPYPLLGMGTLRRKCLQVYCLAEEPLFNKTTTYGIHALRPNRFLREVGSAQ